MLSIVQHSKIIFYYTIQKCQCQENIHPKLVRLQLIASIQPEKS